MTIVGASAVAGRGYYLCRSLGKPPPDILPHPDDIVIDPEKGVSFIGPTTKEEVGRRPLRRPERGN
jgi:hypothetical protein